MLNQEENGGKKEVIAALRAADRERVLLAKLSPAELVANMRISDLKRLIMECLVEMRGSCPAATNPQNVRYGGNKQIKGDEIGY